MAGATIDTDAGPPPAPEEWARVHQRLGQLRRSERWLRGLLANVSDSVSVVDERGRIVFVAGTVPELLGDPDHPHIDDALPFVHRDDRPAAMAALAEVFATPGSEVSVELRAVVPGVPTRDLVCTGVNLLHDDTVRGVVVTARDITAVRRAERLASSQASVLEMIARAAPLDAVLERCVRLIEDNGVGGRSSIYLREDDRLEMRAGRAPTTLNDYLRLPATGPDEPPRSLCHVCIATGEAAVVEDLAASDEAHPELRALGRRLGVGAGWSQPILALGTDEVIGTLSTLYDAPHRPDGHERAVGEAACALVAIAVERDSSEARLAHLALHDTLTGLPNRTLLRDRLDRALARRPGRGEPPTVLFCDLDRFKVVNDSLGHGAGDLLLVAVADRLAEVVGPRTTVARFGGDEFVVLLEDDDSRRAEAVAGHIAATVARPYALPTGQEVHLTVSIGLARAAGHRTGEAWLRDADAAMYRAKDLGRDRTARFDAGMRQAALLRLQVENDLRGAVGRGELVVHYQPVVDLGTGRVRGVEALARWDHPERGLLAPAQFIGVAEETGMIATVGEWVLDQALGDMAALTAERGTAAPLELGVNVSARQLDRPGLDTAVADAFARHGGRPQDLLLELTESCLTERVDEPLDVLDRLRALGVGLAIDDFGTGHSSLTRLGLLPFTQVKIDRSFVAAPSGRLVAAVVAVAGALRLHTCAEGVETAEQLDRVRAEGCDMAQGFLFSPPLPLAGLRDLLATDPTW